MAVAVVADVDEAIAHINRYSTKHSDSIVTHDEANARKFLARSGFGCRLLERLHTIHRRRGIRLWRRNGHQHAETPLPRALRAGGTDFSKYEIVGSGQIRS